MAAKKAEKKPYVVVRSDMVGVTCGELVERNGREVTLAHARRIWEWQGAETTHGVAALGVTSGSKVDVEVEETLILGVDEITICTEAAEKSLRAAKWE